MSARFPATRRNPRSAQETVPGNVPLGGARVAQLENSDSAQDLRIAALEADGGITTAMIATEAVTAEKLNPDTAGAGLVPNGSTGALDVNADGTTLEVAADVLRIKDDGVGKAKINADVAGNGLTQAADGALQANPDGTTLEISSDALRIKDDGVGKAKVNADVAGHGLAQDADGSLMIERQVGLVSTPLHADISGASNFTTTTIGSWQTITENGKTLQLVITPEVDCRIEVVLRGEITHTAANAPHSLGIDVNGTAYASCRNDNRPASSVTGAVALWEFAATAGVAYTITGKTYSPTEGTVTVNQDPLVTQMYIKVFALPLTLGE